MLQCYINDLLVKSGSWPVMLWVPADGHMAMPKRDLGTPQEALRGLGVMLVGHHSSPPLGPARDPWQPFTDKRSHRPIRILEATKAI